MSDERNAKIILYIIMLIGFFATISMINNRTHNEMRDIFVTLFSILGILYFLLKIGIAFLTNGDDTPTYYGGSYDLNKNRKQWKKQYNDDIYYTSYKTKDEETYKQINTQMQLKDKITVIDENEQKS